MIDGAHVLVQNDRHKDGFLAAYDLATGKQVWRTNRDELPTWSTPLVVRSRREPRSSPTAASSSAATTRRRAASCGASPTPATQVKVPTPVVAGEAVIVTGGYPAAGRPIYAMRPGGSGDVAPAALAWQTPNGSPYTGTPLVYEGIVYVCTDNGILTAYDAKTGERIYRSRVSDRAGGFSASPVAAGGHIYLAGEDGDVFVVKAGRAVRAAATNAMGEIAMATPAISGDMLIVRTQGHLLGIAAR